MRKRPPGSSKTATRSQSQNPESAVRVRDLVFYIPEFLNYCEYLNHSPRTIQEAKAVLEKLLTYLKEQKAEYCGVAELRQFLIVVQKGGMQRGGRWGQKKPQEVRPRTVRNYWSYLRTFFNWLVAEERCDVSPFKRLPVPIVRTNQILPFSDEQMGAILRACKHTKNPLRDEAIVHFLLDTGVRASELCGIKCCELDLGGHRCLIHGKGNKQRTVYFGLETKKSLWRYLQNRSIEADEPLFLSTRGTLAGDPLTRAGLLQLIERLGESAQLQGVRCSPHTFRHTASVNFLNNGGNIFTLQMMLGHTDLTMTKRYLNLAEADLQAQSKRFSPVDRLKRGRRENAR